MTTTNRTKVSRGSLEQENLLAIEQEKIEMTLNTDNAIAQGLLIQRLTELYEDPIEATVRETVSNGLDATAVACSGETPTIEIETPSELNPVFIVRDNGVGMTYEDLKNVYSKYGASTKMDNFDQIGAYGLGAKAPLAYGTQFTVSSVRDGIKTTIIVVREELTNYIRVIETGASTEPSGTTVSVPVANNDISAFVNHIEKYKSSPIDYKGQILINGEVVKDDKFALIDEEVVVFDENGEKVTARMWFQVDKDRIVNLITSLNESEFLRGLKFTIGGWTYSSPAARENYNYYRNSGTSSVYIELKPGIVAFNSARDAILMNERFKKFEALLLKYVKSDLFLKKMVATINSLELTMFQKVVMSLIQRSLNNITFENNQIKVKQQSNSYSFMHKFEIADFQHEETGFNFTYITKGVPAVTTQKTAILGASKYGYRSTMEYAVYTSIDGHNGIDRTYRTRASDAAESIHKILESDEKSSSLASFMVVTAINALTGKNAGDRNQITIVTDMVYDEDKKSAYQRAISGRKTIVEMRNEKDLDSFESQIVFTQHTKAEMEKMIEEAMLQEMNIVVKNVSEISEEIIEYRKSNRSTGGGTRTVNSQFSAQIYDKGDQVGDTKRISIAEVDKTKKAVFVVSRDRYISGGELQELANGYSNKNNLKLSEFNLYPIVGNLRVIEINELTALGGEIFEYNRSTGAGTSNMYKEQIAGKHIQPSAFCNLDEDLEKKAFLRLVAGLYQSSPKDSMLQLRKGLVEIKEVLEAFEIDFPSVDVEAMNELAVYGEKTLGSAFSSSYWSLSGDYKNQLIKNLGPDLKATIELVSFVVCRGDRYSAEQIYLTEDSFTSTNNVFSIVPRNKQLAEIIAKEQSALAKVVKGTLELFAQEMSPQVEKLSTIA